MLEALNKYIQRSARSLMYTFLLERAFELINHFLLRQVVLFINAMLNDSSFI